MVEVLRALTSVNNAGMTDVVILTGNLRGAGDMKVARSMFEVSITAEYLEKNPAETDLYLDFAHVIAWKHLQDLERKSPGKVPPEHKRESETQYNRVKAKFEKNGKIRNNVSFQCSNRLYLLSLRQLTPIQLFSLLRDEMMAA